MPLVFYTSSVGSLWACSCWRRFLFGGSFWIRVIFSLVNHSGMSFAFKHLFISRANLSRTEVNFWNQYPCILSWPSVFSFGTFLSVALSELRCIFSFGSSSSPCNFFSVLFIDSAFLSCFLCSHILLQNCCFPVIRLLVCLRAFSSYLRVEFFFSLFWNVPFCRYCLFLSQYLVSLSSFASTSRSISSSFVGCFNCYVAFSLFIRIYSIIFPLSYHFYLL